MTHEHRKYARDVGGHDACMDEMICTVVVLMLALQKYVVYQCIPIASNRMYASILYWTRGNIVCLRMVVLYSRITSIGPF
jgi:hypothetical protein